MEFLMQTTCDNVEKQSKKTDENIRNAVGAISEYEEQIEAAGQKYLTLQKIKAYIADLCDMLQVRLFTLKNALFLLQKFEALLRLFIQFKPILIFPAGIVLLFLSRQA